VRNNDSLHELYFNNFDIGLQCARNIALLLGQRSSMKCLKFDETHFDHGGFAQIATALRSQPQIEELYVFGNYIYRDGYVALGNALEGCLNLRTLELAAYGNDHVDEELIDNEGIHALAEGLKQCQNLTSLELRGNVMITEEGSRSLSTLFQSDNCQLECLDLRRMNIDDGGAAVLASGLASLPSLKELMLCGISVGDQCLQHLMRGLLVNCNIESLDLSRSMLMDSVSGLRALGSLVGRTANMQYLNLEKTSLSDEGLQSFVEGMSNCCRLKELHLSHNDSITANGVTSLSSLFRAEHCSLCTLALYGIHFGDEGAIALANGLIGNKSLTDLRFNSSGITARGWSAFSKLLCDKTSVNSTYFSNHTLLLIGAFDTPSDIEDYLKLNKPHKQASAICKILRSHPDIDVTPLFEFNLMCLPLVVAWFEKAKLYLGEVNEPAEVFTNRQLSAVFKFIRGMPLLAAYGYYSQKKDWYNVILEALRVQLHSKSKKRKRSDQTLCVIS
jgi:Ran GTPase-activating protein (RanGAP) involved in mRNA processing and transport